MRALVVLLAAALLGVLLSAPAAASGDGLDASFGNGGSLLTGVALAEFDPGPVALQNDGKIVVAGIANPDSGGSLGILRFLPNGSADPRFGTNGRVVAQEGSRNGIVEALYLERNGSILVAGVSLDAARTNIIVVVARFRTDGALDAGFGNGGFTSLPLGPSSVPMVSRIVEQPDGKIVLGGSLAKPGSDGGGFLFRLTEAGTLDPSFGAAGSVAGSFGALSAVASLALQADGKIVVVGSVTVSGLPGLGLVRYLANGTPDAGFGKGGLVTTKVDQGASGADLAIDASGRIVAVGTGPCKCFAVARYLPDGTPDPAFNSRTPQTTVIDAGAIAHAVVLQGDGKLVVAGQYLAARDDPSIPVQLAVARYVPDGPLDPSFGTGGIVRAKVGTHTAYTGMALGKDGEMIVAGLTFSDTPGHSGLLLSLTRLVAGPPILAASEPGPVSSRTGHRGFLFAGIGLATLLVIFTGAIAAIHFRRSSERAKPVPPTQWRPPS